jgi:hypothetical protein
MGIDVALIQPAFGAGDVRKLNICTPPLGLAYIAAFLRDRGHHVRIIDAEVEQLNNEQIAQRVKNADLAAITTTAPTYSSALALANRIKQSNSPTKIVFGGPQATFLDRDRLERSAADTPSSEAKGSTRCWTLRTRSNHAARVTLTAPRKEMQIPSSRIPIGN